MKKGAIYARFSSHNQKDESIEQQVEECSAFAESVGVEIVETYADRAISGRTDKRPAFQKMLRDAEKHKFDVVIAYKSNRIARNMLHALQYEDKLSQLGIETYYAKEEYGNTPSGRFALRMMMSMNQFYSENLSEDIKRGMRDNAQKGKVNGSIAYGYRKGADGRYEIDEKKAAIVREIYHRTLKGDTSAEIAADLNARGIKTRYNGNWNKGSFHRMLRNETYTGVYHHSGFVLENAIPQIISKEEYGEMQQFLKNRGVVSKKGSNMNYLLTGKLFCGHCSSPMVGSSATSHTGDKHFYYVCKGRQKHKCKKENVRKADIEAEVVRITKEVFLTDEVIAWVAKSFHELFEEVNADRPILEAQLQDAEKALQNLVKALREGYSKTLSDEVRRVENEINALKRQIAELPDEITEDEVMFFLIDWKAGNLPEEIYAQGIIDTFVKRVTLWDDEIEVEYRPTGKGEVRIKSPCVHHTLSVRTYTITVTTESVRIKGKLPH